MFFRKASNGFTPALMRGFSAASSGGSPSAFLGIEDAAQNEFMFREILAEKSVYQSRGCVGHFFSKEKGRVEILMGWVNIRTLPRFTHAPKQCVEVGFESCNVSTTATNSHN